MTRETFLFLPILLYPAFALSQHDAPRGVERRFNDGAPVFSPGQQALVPLEDAELRAPNRLPVMEHTIGASDSGMFQPVPGPSGGTVRSIVVDSTGRLFIATDGGVYRSTDNGSTWETHLFPTQLYNSVEPVTVLGPNVIAAETDFSNFISTDGGESWEYFSEDVQGFAVDTNGDIYAGSNFGGVKISTDTAKSWAPFALDGKKIWRVVLCGDGKLACPSDSGIFFSSDQGKTWTFGPYETMFTWNLVSDKRGHLFALRYYGRYFELFRSDDFGVSWEYIVRPVEEDAYRIYIESDGRLLVPTNSRILTSTDAGETWTEISCPNWVPLTAGRDIDGNLLVGTFYGMYRLNDSNGEWEEINNGIRGRRIESICFTSAGSVLVLSLSQCFRSTDGGNSWSTVQVDSTVSVNYYAPILSSTSGSIFMAASINNYSESGLLRSTDDGITWEQISVLSNYYAIYEIAEGARGNLLVGTYFGDIYRSANDGESWTKVVSSSAQSEITCIASDNDGNDYAGTDTLVLVSSGGTTWDAIPLRRNYSSWESMVVDQQGRVFLGSSGNGVYFSADTGKTWNLMNDGLYNRYVICTAADDSGNVVLGTSREVFRLADSVDNWVSFSKGFPRTYATSVSISPDGYLFAGTQSYGLYKTVAPIGNRIPKTEQTSSEEIVHFSLFQNYPNPFNPSTSIRFSMPSSVEVSLKIFNVLGEEVATLISGNRDAGTHTVEWDAIGQPSGVYFYRLRAGEFVETRKLIVMR